MKCRDRKARRAKALLHIKFKKHTSRKKRKPVGKVFEALLEKYSEQIRQAAYEAQARALIYGQSGVLVSWDERKNEPKFEVTDGTED